MSGYPGEGGPTVEQEEWLDARGVNGSRTTGPTYPERAAVCVVGDSDPRPPYSDEDEGCSATHRGWYCSLLADHMTQHVAVGGGRVCAVWPVAL